jgi:hypothetical protein
MSPSIAARESQWHHFLLDQCHGLSATDWEARGHLAKQVISFLLQKSLQTKQGHSMSLRRDSCHQLFCLSPSLHSAKSSSPCSRPVPAFSKYLHGFSFCSLHSSAQIWVLSNTLKLCLQTLIPLTSLNLLCLSLWHKMPPYLLYMCWYLLNKMSVSWMLGFYLVPLHIHRA